MSASTPIEPTVTLSNGAVMPRVALGTWKSSPGVVEEAVITAIKQGYRHLDCALIYQNEAEIGRALARAFAEGLVKREELFITSKVWNTAHSPAAARAAIATTLRDLQLEYLDLYLVHWPCNFKLVESGELLPRGADGKLLHETDSSVASTQLVWRELESFVDQGKVRSIGVSNFSTAEIDEVLSYARIRPTVHQIEVHPGFQQDELIASARRQNLVVQAYCPLGATPAEGHTWTAIADPVVLEIAKRQNKTPGQIVLRWGIEVAGVVLPKSVSPTRLAQNLDLFSFQLTAQDLAELRTLNEKNERMNNPPFAVDGSAFWRE